MRDIRVRFWASARSAAGVAEQFVQVSGPISLDDLLHRIVGGRPDGRLAAVLAVCSVLLGDQPVGRREWAEVSVAPGDTVEFLPPFAGG